eukprot:gene14602-22330_t
MIESVAAYTIYGGQPPAETSDACTVAAAGGAQASAEDRSEGEPAFLGVDADRKVSNRFALKAHQVEVFEEDAGFQQPLHVRVSIPDDVISFGKATMSAIVYVDEAPTPLDKENVDIRDCRWQSYVDDKSSAHFTFGCVSGRWMVVVYALTAVPRLIVEVARRFKIAPHVDFQNPWMLCKQAVWCAELEQMLLAWFKERQHLS